MKVKAILFTTIFLATTSVYAQRHIRNADWGWAKDSVKKYETLKLIDQPKEGLRYFGILDDKRFKILYQFIENKFVAAYYSYVDMHINSNIYITSYNQLKDILIKKYGTPLTDEKIWKHDRYKNEEENWGRSCRAGHVVFKSTWENKDTHVELTCIGDDYDILLDIVYRSKQYASLTKKSATDQNEKDF